VRKNSRSPRSVLAQFSLPGRPRQPTGHWHIACANCGNHKIPAGGGRCSASRLAYRLRKLRKTPAMVCSSDTARGMRVGRKGRRSNFLLYRYECYCWGRRGDSNAGIADGDTSYCVLSPMPCFCCPSTERKKSLVESRSWARIASGALHNFLEARSNPAGRLSHHATTRAPRSVQKEKMDRKSSSSTARRQFRSIGICGFHGAHLFAEGLAKPREPSENFQSFQCGKAANPRRWCLLIPALRAPKF
jgi:hypothetical protein